MGTLKEQPAPSVNHIARHVIHVCICEFRPIHESKRLCVGGTKVSSIYKALHHASSRDSRDIQTCLVLFIYLFLSGFICRVYLVLPPTLGVLVSSCKLLLLHIKIYILMNQCLYSTTRSSVAPSGAPRSHKFQEAALRFWRASWVYVTWNFSPHCKTKYGRR